MPLVKATTVVVRETIRDTVITVQADSSQLLALLACDSANQVILKQVLAAHSGDRLKPPEASVKYNYLTVDCKVDSFGIYCALKDSYRSEIETIIETKVVEKNLTAYQGFCLGFGRVMVYFSIAVVAILLFRLLIRLYFKR